MVLPSNTPVTPRTLRYGLILFIGLIVLALTVFQFRFLLTGPQIDIVQTYFEVTDPWIDLRFKVSNTKVLTLQGQEIIPEVSGLVTKRIYVQEGNNIITIEATDLYGTKKYQKIDVFYPQAI